MKKKSTAPARQVQLALEPQTAQPGLSASHDWLKPLASSVIATHAPGFDLAPLRVSSRMRRTLGLYTPSKREVTLNAKLLALGCEDEIKLVLLHELAHAIVHHRSPRAPTHGALFRTICKELGAKPSKYVEVQMKGWHGRTRYAAKCPSCKQEIVRQRRMATARCTCGTVVMPRRWKVVVQATDGKSMQLGTTAPPMSRRRIRM